MKNKAFVRTGWFMCIFSLLLLLPSYGQRTGYSKEELTRRREALMDRAGGGVIVLFGEAMPQPGAHFRQDNDFYYFTGVEDPNGILLMIPQIKEAFLFLPEQTPREVRYEGPNLLLDPGAKEKTGFREIHKLSHFDEFLVRLLPRFGLNFYLRLSPRDFVDNARWGGQIFVARRSRIHYNDQMSLDNHRIQKLRERFPACEFIDVVPLIDELRVIKSREEIEVMRRNGKISAEAVRQAMLTSRTGGYEYEIEAAAVRVILENGARGPAYPPIVGSGLNTCTYHYEKNARRVEDGDLILMDFGADLDYLCMDITRTWPVSGKFSPEQRGVYEIVLAVQKACIEAFRPGLTSQGVERYVDKVMKEKGLNPRGLRGERGHYVGMAVHDVGPRDWPLKEGMVFAIEPALYYPEENIGVRIEDTVLITRDGCEVLTRGVPKEIDEIEELLARRKERQERSAGKILEMTYPFDEKSIYWPTAKAFSLKKVAWGMSDGGWWYASNEFSASEHGGTHADAPIHFAEKGRAMEEIPISEWIGPAVKVDVTTKCAANRDYLLTVEDLRNWEKEDGKIPEGAWVIMYTGIGTRFYPDKSLVLGTEKEGAEAVAELSFPGFSLEAVEFLIEERSINGIAIDTPSIDYGKSKDFKVHQVLFAADKLALENIANLDKLPPSGATLYVIPMRIKEGTGAPARVFAILE